MLNCDTASPSSPEEPLLRAHEEIPLESVSPRFLMAGPKQTLMVSSVQETVQLPVADPQALRMALSDVSKRRGPGYWVGALPFDNSKPCHLLRPSCVRRSLNWSIAARHTNSRLRIECIGASGGDDYRRSVELALEQIANSPLEKVVLAQASDYRVARAPHIPTLLAELRLRNPDATTYAMELPGSDETEKKLLVGSSPELLVSKYGAQVRCLPLAGSRRRSLDPQEDRELKEELLHSAKDKAEHALLVDQLLSDLAPWVEDLSFLRDPGAICTSTMWHLATPIVGRIRSSQITSLDLAMAVHPSAAVCGVPRKNALDTIQRVESRPRGFYAGALGAMNENGDGEWIVTIRGAELTGDRVRIFSGAGVIAGSTPELELQETEDKKQSMLQAIAASIR